MREDEPAVLAIWDRLQKAGVDWYSIEEIGFFYDTVLRLKPDFICEWGTNVGQSARIFYEVVTEVGCKCEIHTVELVDEVRGGRGFHVRGLPVTLHLGDGVEVALLWLESSGCKKPLFFQDDNHVESDVYRQLSRIYEEAPHTVILVHDVYTVMAAGSQVVPCFHEPGRAILRFLDEGKNDFYEVVSGETMMRLWPHGQD